jgi:hypothetical protein
MEAKDKTFKEKIKALLNLSEEVAVETPVVAPEVEAVALEDHVQEAPEAPVEDAAPFSDEEIAAIKSVVEDVINELSGGVEDAPVVDMTEATEVLAAVEVVEDVVELEAVVEPIKPSPTKEATNTLKFKIGDKRKASRQDFINSQIFRN